MRLAMIVIISMAVIYVVWNIIVFFMYASDKNRAKRGDRRISEKTLLLSAALMGGVGAFLGMQILRHKTQHTQFVIGVPLCILLNIVAAGIIIYLLFF